MNTIFALSSGQPPAAIGVLRISGPQAGEALRNLAGALPIPRHASFRTLRDVDGSVLDQALVLWFPGPHTATGEDLAELHLHGGRAVIAGVEKALARFSGLRRAEPGEFTRRAFANGRMDLAEAEGLADLLLAETELQRRAAVEMAGGLLSRQVIDWRDRVLTCSARVEAVLDFADEDDVAVLPPDFTADIQGITEEIGKALDAPHAETLREGFRVVLAGPPNAGKSTLFNALVETEAAITSPSAGTTRDVLIHPVALDGLPFCFIDTAGLREEGAEEIEAIGIARAQAELEKADLVLWLGPEGEGPVGAWEIETQIDVSGHPCKAHPRHRVSGLTGEGVMGLKRDLVAVARVAMPRPGQAALNLRQRSLLGDAFTALGSAAAESDPLLLAEQLRLARLSFDRLIGRSATEDMLDALFGRFCIGK
ncbi:tRNA uridine-5-carboxymethylaminomethyl(34) synthesis GTPase MnmE [Altererythrobacter sp. CC-YST694]|uniref:tRNA uridine-5-carboxymethylaminomethyl(34) synthesis GTPase MnmE n=1 Tax=Altererythrobacter sp. CC-YST694 TaxID=2755038 RepID=UPI001D014397|nr:tRNA uridine-5-carboxymethylaminomethyl(34) synthesis GTPase MnmE [Altererythrobacter sp. CC-YST694]MCB5425371.1 tRNA uridine-5-carboxymethylaminomethyl(34) synthesis GTPase MnmE [Altererythrobacter sp. CC-YST694]